MTPEQQLRDKLHKYQLERITNLAADLAMSLVLLVAACESGCTDFREYAVKRSRADLEKWGFADVLEKAMNDTGEAFASLN